MAGMGLFFWGGTEVLLPYPGYIKEFSAPLAQMHAPFPCVTAQAVPIPQVHPKMVQHHTASKKLTTINKLMLYHAHKTPSDTRGWSLWSASEGGCSAQYHGKHHPAPVLMPEKRESATRSQQEPCKKV